VSDPLVTARLRGLPLSQADFDDLYALHRDERVLAAFDAEPSSAAETQEFLDRKLAHWSEHGFGIWMFRDLAGAFVGRCGIHRWTLDGQPEVELGYIVRSELWSLGYATEIAAAVVSHAFSVLALPELVGFTRLDNPRSRRVLEKLGFLYERTFLAAGKESVLYRRRSQSATSASSTAARRWSQGPRPGDSPQVTSCYGTEGVFSAGCL
jgi:RimJ/RimL family protein N-acetyltransferase